MLLNANINLASDEPSRSNPLDEHSTEDQNNRRNEPTIESTENFITTWLTGGDAPDRTLSIIPREKLSFDDYSFESESVASSNRRKLDMSASISLFEEETHRSPALRLCDLDCTDVTTDSANVNIVDTQTLVTTDEKTQNPRVESPMYKHRESIISSESLDSYTDSPTKMDKNSDTRWNLPFNSKHHRQGSMVSPRRFSFRGSPTHDFDMQSSMDHSPVNSFKEQEVFARCTSKVRRLCLDDRPHPRFHHEFMDDHSNDSYKYMEGGKWSKRQLFVESQSDSKLDTKKILDESDFINEVSPKDIFSFPENDIARNHVCPLPPIDNITPITSKKEIGLSPFPPMKKSSAPLSPITPSILRKAKMRSIYEDDAMVESPLNQVRSDSNKDRIPQSRFNQDFQIVDTIGSGSFGTVYKCLSRLDGCMYAVKAAKKIAKGVADLDRMLKEVHALAALSDLTDPATFHIVRYHQAWLEDRRLFIQTELCTSTLSHEVRMHGAITYDTQRRYKLLREMSLALDLIHRKELVHLDIKPDNIFIKNDQYKLGDFGLVNKSSIRGEVDEEGDSRYMARDLLGGFQLDLTKVLLSSFKTLLLFYCAILIIIYL
jgi:hypothetical protein